MTKVTIGNTPLVMAKNPWCDVDMCKSSDYYRKAPPWDKRRQGMSALSDKQMAVVKEFSQVASSRNEPRECKDKSGMARNKCRVLAIGKEMRGQNFGRGRRRSEGRRPRRRYEEE